MQMAQELLLLVASEENRGQTNQSIAHYCLAHFDDLLHMSITQLASACHVSAATITRFCHSLGYDDFLHFKDECALDRRMRARSAYYCGNVFGYDKAALVPPALQDSCRTLGKDLYACLSGVDPRQMQALADAIRAADDVLLLGMEYSGLMMLYLQRELVKRGKIIRVLLSTANLSDVTVGPGTLILMLSMNGCGLEVMMDAVQRLAEKCGAFWLLTQNAETARKYPFVKQAVVAGAGQDYTFHRYAELALADMLLAYYGPLKQFDANGLPLPQGHGIL